MQPGCEGDIGRGNEESVGRGVPGQPTFWTGRAAQGLAAWPVESAASLQLWDHGQRTSCPQIPGHSSPPQEIMLPLAATAKLPWSGVCKGRGTRTREVEAASCSGPRDSDMLPFEAGSWLFSVSRNVNWKQIQDLGFCPHFSVPACVLGVCTHTHV